MHIHRIILYSYANKEAWVLTNILILATEKHYTWHWLLWVKIALTKYV